jgi:hypothetical protein
MSDAWMPFQPAIDDRDVLLLAAGVGEAQVDELDLLVLERLEHVGGGSHGNLLSEASNERTMQCNMAGTAIARTMPCLWACETPVRQGGKGFARYLGNKNALNKCEFIVSRTNSGHPVQYRFKSDAAPRQTAARNADNGRAAAVSHPMLNINSLF